MLIGLRLTNVCLWLKVHFQWAFQMSAQWNCFCRLIISILFIQNWRIKIQKRRQSNDLNPNLIGVQQLACDWKLKILLNLIAERDAWLLWRSANRHINYVTLLFLVTTKEYQTDVIHCVPLHYAYYNQPSGRQWSVMLLAWCWSCNSQMITIRTSFQACTDNSLWSRCDVKILDANKYFHRFIQNRLQPVYTQKCQWINLNTKWVIYNFLSKYHPKLIWVWNPHCESIGLHYCDYDLPLSHGERLWCQIKMH